VPLGSSETGSGRARIGALLVRLRALETRVRLRPVRQSLPDSMELRPIGRRDLRLYARIYTDPRMWAELGGVVEQDMAAKLERSESLRHAPADARGAAWRAGSPAGGRNQHRRRSRDLLRDLRGARHDLPRDKAGQGCIDTMTSAARERPTTIRISVRDIRVAGARARVTARITTLAPDHRTNDVPFRLIREHEGWRVRADTRL
jgi:hypothetical protein